VETVGGGAELLLLPLLLLTLPRRKERIKAKSELRRCAGLLVVLIVVNVDVGEEEKEEDVVEWVLPREDMEDQIELRREWVDCVDLSVCSKKDWLVVLFLYGGYFFISMYWSRME
jgi:hypothetical protein